MLVPSQYQVLIVLDMLLLRLEVFALLLTSLCLMAIGDKVLLCIREKIYSAELFIIVTSQLSTYISYRSYLYDKYKYQYYILIYNIQMTQIIKTNENVKTESVSMVMQQRLQSNN